MLGKRTVLIALAAIAVLTIGGLLGCAAQSPASAPKSDTEKPAAAKPAVANKVDFPTKPITFVVPVSAGGGFDIMARALAPFLQKYLPNNPNVVVKNVTGGEWAIGINEVYNAQPDGYTIGMFNLPGNVMNQILGLAKYDLTKVTWIGKVSHDGYIMATSPKSGLKTLQDLQKAPEVKVATVSLSSSGGMGTAITAERMGFKPRFILHKGAPEAMLAAIRGDADVVQANTAVIHNYVVQTKELNPLWLIDKKRLPELPDVPTVGEINYPDLLDTVILYFMVGTTPGTPPEVAQILRDAFDKAMADPEFAKKLEATGGNVVIPGKADEVEAIVKNCLTQYAKYKDEIQKYIK